MSDTTPSTTTPQGFTKAKYLTDQQIDTYIEALREGKSLAEAADLGGSSQSQFRTRCTREPELKQRVEQAMEEGLPAYRDRLRSVRDWHIFEDKNYKAWRDTAMVVLPEYEVLRTTRFEHSHSGTIELEAKLAQYSTEELRAILALEEARAEEHPVLELPQKSQAA
jgi:hypothetical protein